MRAALISSASVSASSTAPVALYPLAVERTYPTELAAAVTRGAVVVDIRTHAQRAAQGTLPGALAIESALVAERLDPAHPGRLAVAVDHHVEWILVSAEGSDSHHTVTDLHRRGLRGVTHLVGGYAAIRAAGMVEAVSRARHIAEDVARVTAH